jgi:hypothetical protein
MNYEQLKSTYFDLKSCRFYPLPVPHTLCTLYYSVWSNIIAVKVIQGRVLNVLIGQGSVSVL